MADRLDYYFMQRVTEAELDLGFELFEKADRNLAADIGIYSVVSGAEPSEHQPVPDLTIDLVAPAGAYDHVGPRIFFGTDQNVGCSVGHIGKVKAYIQFVLALSAKAITPRASSSKRRDFNPDTARHDFRVFLLHLGLIGDEFKTARKHLMANLNGSVAWKHGRSEQRASA